METSPYKIYSASAGSGKTYTLAKEYLKIILSSATAKSYRQILAITFTNKAVNEMKQRILDNLYAFSKVDEENKPSDLFLDVAKELNVSTEELQKRAKQVHKSILHNYAFFDISTIDKFTHRLIRTFAKDLKIPQNFEVVLDIELLLSEAVERLLAKAGTDKLLTSTLLEFTFEKIDDDKSWDISFDLNKVGKMLFNENNIEHLKSFKTKSITNFLELKKTLSSTIKNLEDVAIQKAKTVDVLIQTEGIDVADFPRQTLPNHFKKIVEGEFSLLKLYKNKLGENLEQGKIFKATVKNAPDHIAPMLLEIYNSVKNTIYQRAMYKNVYANLVPLTVLNEIQKEINAICKERDQLTLASFNAIISKEIKNQPAPFIYERLGEKYRHYFVDEFQDTSELQWQNLIPLIGNALESLDDYGKKGSLLLVGDAKQAIYRWRGGKAEQFIKLTNKEELPYVLEPKTTELPRNYRSYSEIINFNNNFFTITSNLLNNTAYADLYVSGNKQEINTKTGGLVTLSFIPNEKEEQDNDLYCESVLETITALTSEKKYNYKDICILVRSNNHSYVLADFLTSKEIPVISSESLLLKSSEKVSFLLNLLTYSTQPKDKDTAYEILYFLAEKGEDTHQFIQKHLNNLEEFLLQQYGFAIDKLKQLSVFDAFEKAIHQFKLAETSDAYLISLMDEVLDVEQKDGVSAQTFLTYWDKKKDKLSLKAPDNINAVQIMTVHKSKGLEFPIVIFPFANSFIYGKDEKIWLPVDPEQFNGFSEVLVTKKQEMEQYGDLAAKLFLDEHSKQELDAFNVLYVALTRAVKALYIISKKELNTKGEPSVNKYSGLFIKYLQQLGLWSDTQLTYSFGNLQIAEESTAKVEKLNHINYQYSTKDRPSFKILTKSGMLWETGRDVALEKGNLIHLLLSYVKTKKDVDNAISIVIRDGHLTPLDVAVTKQKVLTIIEHPDLAKYYKEGNIVKNEKDIITAEGLLLRPDRVVINTNNEATVIDYKTGAPNNSYHQQVNSYAYALETMNYKVVSKIIVYINDNITPEFII
ncbi:ATP-dependent exoDNAse (exonuclease V) beta subunit [Cellulophaga sp. RHA_52]|uniref:UvrD-helicase domain-containing protein n=1 Tax=Cellulophaga sp. RHA_52 TaxID=1250036 RepID=UPI00119B48C3|nr:UvrD-helicase domain-containing protein [Cellulophaga sp. RHA_52]TVZ08361.1 ATP-dependent exoDNAse (exonuclease V) beta subunit [Cellulophaga sp. RHA_52]